MTDPARTRAIAMMVVAAICWSSGGYLVRQLALRDAWEIVFWRSVFMALFVLGVLVAMHRRRTAAAVRAVGWPGLAAGAFLACTFFFFIASLTRTTVANTFVLMSVSPFLAAIAGRLVLGERVPARSDLRGGDAEGELQGQRALRRRGVVPHQAAFGEGYEG